MVKPIVRRSKRRTEVIYNKKKKDNTNKIIIFEIIAILILTLALGLGLGLGLKKKSKTDLTLFNKKDYYPVKVIYNEDNEEAKQLLKDIYEPDNLYITYIRYDSKWGKAFADQLVDTEIVILAGVKFGSNYNKAKGNYKYHFETRILKKDNRNEIYNAIKKWRSDNDKNTKEK